MNRRKFIQSGMLSIASLLGLCRPGEASAVHQTENSRARLLPPLMANRYFDPETVREIGRKYLGMKPVFRHYGDLVQAVHDGGDIGGLAGRWSRQKACRQKTAQDYAGGRTEIVDGWVLSRNELELFALQALIDSKQA